MPFANSGASSPLSAASTASFRTVVIRTSMETAPRPGARAHAPGACRNLNPTVWLRAFARGLGTKPWIQRQYGMNSVWQDFRHSLRGLRNRPSFTLLAVLALALGIDAATTIVSAIQTVLLAPFP